MESDTIALFEREIARQSSFALRAVADLDAALRPFELDEEDLLAEGYELAASSDYKRTMREQSARRVREHADANARAWYAIQSFLVFAGNVSKLLWGTSAGRRSARQSLRHALSVEDDSPLEDRRLRNHFEHFDERLDAWAADGHPPVSDGNIRWLPKYPHLFWRSNQRRMSLREFDHFRWIVSFYDEQFELRPIIEALRELQPLAEKDWRERLGY